MAYLMKVEHSLSQHFDEDNGKFSGVNIVKFCQTAIHGQMVADNKYYSARWEN